MMNEQFDATPLARILSVDDDADLARLYPMIFKQSYLVRTAQSGEAALSALAAEPFDLVLLDVKMPGMDGYETCRRLRQKSDVPVIFVTGYQGLDEHLMAFDAGGNDIITKPFHNEMLTRKVEQIIAQRRKTTKLVEEKDSLQKLAMDFLSSVGETGTLLNFMRASVGCRTHSALAQNLVSAMGELGLSCCVQLRHADGPTYLTSAGEPTPLECAILEQIGQMGRIFQFRRRLAVNYDRVSIVVSNLPVDDASSEKIGRLRDNVVVLAETCEGLCENVDMRIKSAQRAEQMQLAMGDVRSSVAAMQRQYFSLLGDVRLSLDNLFSELEQSFTWLGVNHQHEKAFIRTVRGAVDPILHLLEEGGSFEKHFDLLLNTLNGHSGESTFDLF